MRRWLIAASLVLLSFTPSKHLIEEIENYYHSMMPPQIHTADVSVWFSGLNLPVFNAVTHFYSTTNVGQQIDNILAQAPSNKPVSFWIDSLQNSDPLIAELEHRGFRKIVTCPFMTWTVDPIEKPTFTIKRADQNTFHSILGIVNQLDPETQVGYQALLEHSPAEHYLVYLDDQPVGTGTLFVHDKVGCLFNIAVLPEFQNKGCGKAISQFLMHRAYELKLDKVVLNASPAAQKMYQQLGFIKAYDLDIYARL